MTRVAYLVLLGVVVLQRLAELRLSRRNSHRARAAGAVEMGAGHYPWMVALHSAFLIACALEVWLARRPFVPLLAAAALGVLLAATILRYAAISALGERWTTRVYSWPGRPLVESGPYRLIRHPNYVAVALEIVALPLVHSAWVTAAVFTVLNAWLLRVRIQVEERALEPAAQAGVGLVYEPGTVEIEESSA